MMTPKLTANVAKMNARKVLPTAVAKGAYKHRRLMKASTGLASNPTRTRMLADATAKAKAKIAKVKGRPRAEKKTRGSKTHDVVVKLASRPNGCTRQDLLKAFPDAKNVTPKMLVGSAAKRVGKKFKQFDREGTQHYAIVG